MPTKFFIGGNKFYDSEEEAEAELAMFMAEHGIPHDTFVVVGIHQDEPEERLESPVTVH